MRSLRGKIKGKNTVFITDQGNRFHYDLNCGGIKRTIYMIRLSEVGNRKNAVDAKLRRMQEDYGKMLQNTLILGFFSISAFQDYRNRKINIYFLLTGGIIGLLFHLYSMELSIIEILLGMGIGMMILFLGYGQVEVSGVQME